MSKLKIATFNAEWMICIFGGEGSKWDGTIPASFKGKSLGSIKLPPVADVPGLCNRIAGVIKKVDPDVLGIVEGPPRKDQMEKYVKDYLEGEYAVYESNSKSQSIFMLVRKSLQDKVTQVPYDSPDLAPLNTKTFYYPWVGYRVQDQKKHGFDRIPLVLKFKPSAKCELQFVVVHTKSKFSKLKTKKQWDAREKVPVLDALDARQKLSAEVALLRHYLDKQLAPPDENKGLIVMGDFNDGPFAELMESEFLLHNILDELVGSFLWPELFMHHAMTPKVLATAKTVRFPDPLQGGAMTEELIDHILISSSIASGNGAFRLKSDSCQVEIEAYALFDADVNHNDRGLRPSDHKPVSAIIKY